MVEIAALASLDVGFSHELGIACSSLDEVKLADGEGLGLRTFGVWVLVKGTLNVMSPYQNSKPDPSLS